jgi:hypothetical protein
MRSNTLESHPNMERLALWVLAGLAGIGALGVLIYYLTRPPQMGTSDAVFNTVDALYTAVRLKDTAKVEACEKRLNQYKEKGELPKDAAKSLDKIIQMAKEGSWQPATERLYDFMLAQRRDGVMAHSEPVPKQTTVRK